MFNIEDREFHLWVGRKVLSSILFNIPTASFRKSVTSLAASLTFLPTKTTISTIKHHTTVSELSQDCFGECSDTWRPCRVKRYHLSKLIERIKQLQHFKKKCWDDVKPNGTRRVWPWNFTSLDYCKGRWHSRETSREGLKYTATPQSNG